MVEAQNFDVAVLGHGIAGLTAAVSAMHHGAKVAVVERAPIEECGATRLDQRLTNDTPQPNENKHHQTPR